MNKRQFLKTGILGAIIGFFAPKLIAKEESIKLLEQFPFNKNQKFDMFATVIVSSPSQPDLTSDNLFLKPCLYKLEGCFRELLMKQHRQTLATLARAVAEDKQNKHLNLDYPTLLKEFTQKYKITNINK